MLSSTVAVQSLKSLLTKKLTLGNSDAEAQAKKEPMEGRRFHVERIANGLIVSPGMPGVVRYCKDATEAAELIAEEIRRAFK